MPPFANRLALSVSVFALASLLAGCKEKSSSQTTDTPIEPPQATAPVTPAVAATAAKPKEPPPAKPAKVKPASAKKQNTSAEPPRASAVASERAQAEAEAAAKNEANRRNHAAEVERLTAEHQEKVAQYQQDKAAFDSACLAYRTAKAEFDAATKLVIAVNLYNDSKDKAFDGKTVEAGKLMEFARKRCQEIMKLYPDTQAATGAKTVLDGGEARARTAPAQPTKPVPPKAPPPLVLPPPPATVPVVYPDEARAAEEKRRRQEAHLKANPYTLELYNQISATTYLYFDEAIKILGPRGTELSHSEIGSRTYQTIRWSNRDGSSITIIFRNGYAFSKSQNGLK